MVLNSHRRAGAKRNGLGKESIRHERSDTGERCGRRFRKIGDGIREVASRGALDTAFVCQWCTPTVNFPPGDFRPVWASFRKAGYREFSASLQTNAGNVSGRVSLHPDGDFVARSSEVVQTHRSGRSRARPLGTRTFTWLSSPSIFLRLRARPSAHPGPRPSFGSSFPGRRSAPDPRNGWLASSARRQPPRSRRTPSASGRTPWAATPVHRRASRSCDFQIIWLR